ncbi:MAG: hypothetical protein EB120_08450 [Proteobacteria bacterium]|nr:hypothetical protein [Pseudomonadota bacterium]
MDKLTTASRKARAPRRSQKADRNRKERSAMKAPSWYPFPVVCPTIYRELKEIEKQFWEEFPEALI